MLKDMVQPYVAQPMGRLAVSLCGQQQHHRIPAAQPGQLLASGAFIQAGCSGALWLCPAVMVPPFF
jgi:hypothetical protein